MDPTYATPDDLRAELGLDDTVLTDEAADRLLLNAELRVDRMLGAWPTDPDLGRKIDVSWAWLTDAQLWSLSQATVKLAAIEQRDPVAFAQRRFTSVSGPDFSESGEVEAASGDDARLAVLATGLVRATATASPDAPASRRRGATVRRVR